MSTNYHTAFGVNDVVGIVDLNRRFAQLDEGIRSQGGSVASASAALLSETKSTGVDGGASTAATWHTRALNTETDPDGIVTLSSSQFTPSSGTYMIWGVAMTHDGGLNKLRLRNVTQSSTAIVGLAMTNAGVNTTEGMATLLGAFTPNGTDAYELQHYITSAVTGDGLGEAVSDGADEIYAQVLLLKVG